MRLIEVNGIPHWTDGLVTLPIMAGGDKYDIPGADNPKAPTGPKPGTLPKDMVVRNWDQFRSLIPDYEGRTMADIVRSPLFNGQGAYTFDPAFYKQLQDTMVQLEAGYGVVPSEQPAGILGSKSKLKEALNNAAGGGAGGGGGGSGGGGGGSLTPYGYAAPDPASAIDAKLKYYEEQVAAGKLPQEQALQQFGAELDAFNANRLAAEAANQDIRERAIAEANRKTNLNQEATSRATSIAQNIIPNIIGGNQAGLNVPMLGYVPGNQVDVGQLYGQGLPSLQTQWDSGIPQVNAFDFPGTIAAPQLPQYQAPALPDLSGLIGQLQSGSGPMGFA